MYTPNNLTNFELKEKEKQSKTAHTQEKENNTKIAN